MKPLHEMTYSEAMADVHAESLRLSAIWRGSNCGRDRSKLKIHGFENRAAIQAASDRSTEACNARFNEWLEACRANGVSV